MPTSKSYKTRKRTSSYGSRTASKSSRAAKWSPRTFAPTRFSNVGKEIQCRISSFRNIHSQFNGAGKVTAFSPTTVNKWIKLVNNGNRVYKFSNIDFCKHFGAQWAQANPTGAQRYLKQKFGAGIKAVTRGKANCWLVAATPNVSGRPFINYPWK